MKHLIYVYLSLICVSAFSQTNRTILVEYQATLDDKSLNEGFEKIIKKDTNALYAKTLKSIISATEPVKLYLKVVNSESLFFQEEKMEIGNKKLNITSIIAGKGTIYTNIKSKEQLRAIDAYGKDFLIKRSTDSLVWKLHKETKTIDQYLCYKATTVNVVVNKKGRHEEEVIAWYTPQVSVPFGPSRYCNLPGLILELQKGKLSYKAFKVVINPERIVEITKPTKGKAITKEEFDVIGLEMSLDYN